jgi:hypothetical protein
MVIADNIAKKYFNGENPVGRTIYLNNDMDDPFTISGRRFGTDHCVGHD